MADVLLNLGAGDVELEGYTPIDRKMGDEVYPLHGYEDGSVDVIRASHVLEHFSHREVSKVVEHWVSKLKPGGKLKIAVPDFMFVAKNYIDRKPINVQGYTMGGHNDENDRHGCVFDKESLAEVMVGCGLENVRGWESDIQDCARLDVSLNLMGDKPISDDKMCKRTTAVLSAPRFGPIMHMKCASRGFERVGVRYQICQGAYWHQILCEVIEGQLDTDIDFIITCDYDTVFQHHDVLSLYRLMRAYPDADAICPLQMKRGSEFALFGASDDDGNSVTSMYASDFNKNLTRISTAHFGLTIFRVEALRSLPRPWMLPKPNDEGRWADGKVDADIDFWHRFAENGNKLYLANRVVIGHLQEMIVWPGRDMSPVHQDPRDYDSNGPLPEVIRYEDCIQESVAAV